jgi:hypothetical protein
MGDAEDFWPPMEDVEDAKSPVVLLRKQAEALTDKSGHRLRGRVSTATIRLGNAALEAMHIDPYGPNRDTFTHVFSIEVPALDDYRYNLFSVSHGLEGYPVVHEKEDGEWQALANAEEFTNWLKQTLSSEKTRRVLRTLREQAGKESQQGFGEMRYS